MNLKLGLGIKTDLTEWRYDQRRVQLKMILYGPIGAIDIYMSVSTGNVYTCTYTYITETANYVSLGMS